MFYHHEVHYDDDGKPCGYTENGTPVMGETAGELQGVLNWMQECLEKPALWAGDKFPMEYDKGLM